jgi:hypothetical protein
MKFSSWGMGQWAFIIGLLIVLLLGFAPDMLDPALGTALLVVIALVVSFLNITTSESQRTLLAGVVLAIVGSGFLAGAIGGAFPAFEAVFMSLGVFFLAIVAWLAIITVFFSSRKK